jgi:hypothetical protein
MNLTFIGLSDRTSGLIRGKQVAQYLKDAEFIDINNHHKIATTKNTTCIFIRQFDKNLALQLKRNNCKVGYDLLDRPVADHHAAWKSGTRVELDWARYKNENTDFYLVNNTTTLNCLSPYVNVPIYVMPHHTVNFARHVNQVRDKVVRIGYVGLPDQFLLNDDIKKMCLSHNIEFVNHHPNTLNECDKLLQTIDVGVIFMDTEGYREYVIRHKPNVKLNNFQSYGIPTVACGYHSFYEFGGKPGENWLLANDSKTFISSVENLILDKNLRKTLSHNCVNITEKVHIENVVKLYQNVVTL